jgi:hypothetical protein
MSVHLKPLFLSTFRYLKILGSTGVAFELMPGVKQSNSVTGPKIAFSKQIMGFYKSRSPRVTILPPRSGE